MSKKSRQQRRRNPRPKPKSQSSKGSGDSAASSKLAPQEIEGKARQAEAAGDFERARSGYVRLYREDAEKFGDDYCRVSREAFRALLRNGMPAKAEEVLKQTSEALSADELAEWQMRLAAEREQWETALPIAVSLLTSADPRYQHVAADVIVATAVVPEQLTLPDDAMSARRAMELFCEGSTAEALQVARAVPRTSLFAPWSLFIKGSGAFYDGNYASALEAFRRIPEQCAAAKIAQALLATKGKLLDPDAVETDAREAVRSGQLALILELGGEAKLAQVLPECLRTLDTRGLAAAYDYVRDKYPGFVSLDTGCGATLTTSFLGAAVYQPNQDRLISRILSRKNASPMDGAVAAILNYRGSQRGLIYVEDPWSQLLKGTKKVLDQWPHWNLVQAFVWLDRITCLEREYAEYGDEEEKEEILELIRETVEMAPESESVALRYLKTLDSFRETSERNRFLDTAAERFPDNAAILEMAADRCVERNAKTKALKYLERAIERDPTNLTILDKLVVCAINLARQHYTKRKPKKGAEMMDLALRYAPDRGKTLSRSGLVMARRSLISRLYEADPAAEAEWKRRAGGTVPGDALEFFLVDITAFYYRNPDLPTKKEFNNRMTAAAASPCTESIGLMIETITAVKAVGLPAPTRGKVLKCLQGAFSSTFASYVRNAPDAARKIPDFIDVLVKLDRTMASKLLPAWLRARGDEEGAIAAELIDSLILMSGPGRKFPSSGALKKLEQRATACAASELAQWAGKLFNKASYHEQRQEEEDHYRRRGGSPMNPFFDDDDDEDDDDDDYDDDDDDDGGLDVFFGRSSGGGMMSPADRMTVIMAILAAPASEREAFRKEMGMPKAEWDEFLRYLKSLER